LPLRIGHLVRVGQGDHAVGDGALAGQPLGGLGQQPPGAPDRGVQVGGQSSQPPVCWPAAQHPANGTRDGLCVPEAVAGEPGDLGGELVDLRHRDAGPAQHLAELVQPPFGGAAAVAEPVPEPDPGRRSARPDPADQPTELADRVLQQVGIGRVVDVGGDHGGVDAQFAATQQLVAGELGHQRRVELLEDLRAGAADQLDQRGRVRHRLVQRDAGKAPPGDRVAHLPDQRLVAKLVAVLEVQQADHGRDRDRRAAQPLVEQRPPRRDEPLVVQVGVDPGELVG